MRGGLRHKWSLLRGQWLAHASAASGHWVARPSGRGIADVSPAAMQSARDGLQQDGGASRSSQPGRAESASSGGNTDEVRTHPSGRSVTASLLAAAGSSNPAGPCLPCLPELQHSHGPLLYVTGIQDRQLALPSACRGAEQAHGVIGKMQDERCGIKDERTVSCLEVGAQWGLASSRAAMMCLTPSALPRGRVSTAC